MRIYPHTHGLGMCGFLRNKWVCAVWFLRIFGENMDWIKPEGVRKQRKLELVTKNSVWRRLRRAKKGFWRKKQDSRASNSINYSVWVCAVFKSGYTHCRIGSDMGGSTIEPGFANFAWCWNGNGPFRNTSKSAHPWKMPVGSTIRWPSIRWDWGIIARINTIWAKNTPYAPTCPR